jgi:putative acetyltransferase
VTIRPYSDDDLGQLLDVWYRASLIAHWFLTEEFLETERRQIAEHWLPIAETLVAENDGVVVGFLAMIGNEVGGIFVDPDFQGRGIGRALMDAARDSRPFLELDVFEANSVGRRFYDAYGFDVIGRHINEVVGQPELRLRLGIGPSSKRGRVLPTQLTRWRSLETHLPSLPRAPAANHRVRVLSPSVVSG